MAFPANAIGLAAGVAAGVYYGYQAQPAIVAGTATFGIPPYFGIMDWVIVLGLLLVAIFFSLVLS